MAESNNFSNMNRLFSTAGTGQSRQGTGYTNLNRLFDANKNNQLGQKVAGDVSKQISGVQNQLGQEQQKFNEKSQENRLDTEENKNQRDSVIGRFSNASGSTPAEGPNQKEMDTFGRFRSGAYGGPSQLQDTTSLTATASGLNRQLSDYSPSGTQELLKRSVGGNRYGQGQQRLDSLLLDKSKLIPLQRQSQGLGQQINNANTAAQGTAQLYKNQAQQFGNETMDQLTGARSGISAQVDTDVTNAQAAEVARVQQYKSLKDLFTTKESAPAARAQFGEVSGIEVLQVSPQDKLNQGLSKLQQLGALTPEQIAKITGDRSKATGFTDFANQINSANSAISGGSVSQAQVDQLKNTFGRFGKQGDIAEKYASIGGISEQAENPGQFNVNYNKGLANELYKYLQEQARQSTGYADRAKTQGLDFQKMFNDRINSTDAVNLTRTGVANEAQAGNINALDTLAGKSGSSLEFQKSRELAKLGKTGFDVDSLTNAITHGEGAFGGFIEPTAGPAEAKMTLERAIGGTLKDMNYFDPKNPILSGAATLAALPISAPISLIKNAPKLISGVGRSIGRAFKKFCFTGNTEVMLEDGSFKKLSMLKEGDVIKLGGKITSIGKAIEQDIYKYKGFTVTGGHAIYEFGKWLRVSDSNNSIPLGKEKGVEVYPLSTENHLMVTKSTAGILVSSDFSEVDDNKNTSDEENIKILNSDKVKNKKIDNFLKEINE